MLDNPSDLIIVGERGSIGYLKANIIPTDHVIYNFINIFRFFHKSNKNDLNY